MSDKTFKVTVNESWEIEAKDEDEAKDIVNDSISYGNYDLTVEVIEE